MKKLLSLFLILMLVVSLGACSTKEAANEGTEQNNNSSNSTDELVPEDGAELLVWESEGPEGEWIEYIAEKFEEEYGVKVTYEAVGAVDAREKLAQDGPAGVGADLFAAPHDHTGALVASGLVQNNHIPEKTKNEFMEAAVDGLSYQGIVYGYPTAIETYALYYNKEIFPEAPTTYDEIIAKGKEYNDVNNNKFAFMWDVGNAYYTHSFVAGGGGYVFGQGGTDKDDIGIDSEGAIAGAQSMLDLKEILPVNSQDSTTQIMEGLFDEGTVGAMIDGPWAVNGRKESGIDFGIAPLPKLSNGKQQSSFSGMRGLFISAYTKYPNAARLFAEFATSEEMLLKRFEITQQIPPKKSLMEAEQIKNDEYVAPFLEQAQFAVPMPSIPQMQYVWEPYGNSFASMWNEGTSPEEALGNAAEVVREAIKAE
ncbi:MAG: maltose ABC transporter substrate-binding protein [Firmicutes bacterium]|nr:maltose ABC transporter substrate-binding protein [Bacillota bacterium]